MKYSNIVQGVFLKRVNRFIAHVLVDGIEEIVHVKNTGRCRELFIHGAAVFLERSQNPERKTAYSVIGVYKGDRLINIDSQVPNQVVSDAVALGCVPEIVGVEMLKREVTYGNSRFDIYFESQGKKGFIEVKGVTLEENGRVMFPDAPTTRGTKHVYEMIKAVEEGYLGIIFFLIQMKGVKNFSPNRTTDETFAVALEMAAAKGVILLAYDSFITENQIILGDRVEILL